METQRLTGGDHDNHGWVNNGTRIISAAADGMTVDARTPAVTVKGNGGSSHAEVLVYKCMVVFWLLCCEPAHAFKQHNYYARFLLLHRMLRTFSTRVRCAAQR